MLVLLDKLTAHLIVRIHVMKQLRLRVMLVLLSGLVIMLSVNVTFPNQSDAKKPFKHMSGFIRPGTLRPTPLHETDTLHSPNVFTRDPQNAKNVSAVFSYIAVSGKLTADDTSYFEKEPRSSFIWQIENLGLDVKVFDTDLSSPASAGTLTCKLYFNNTFLQTFTFNIVGNVTKDTTNLFAQYSNPLTYQQSDRLYVVSHYDFASFAGSDFADVQINMSLNGRQVPIRDW